MTRSRPVGFLVAGLLLALLLAGVGSYYADSDPDGLTKVAEDQGFAATEREHRLADSPLAGYETRDVDDPRLSGGLAGVVGVVVTFGAAGALTYAVRRRRPGSSATIDR